MIRTAPDGTNLAGRSAGLLRMYWRNVGLTVLALFLVLLSLKTVFDASTASGRIEVPFRYRIYAVPIVLSQIYYGRPYDYVGYKRLEEPFEAADARTEDLIAALRSIENVESRGLFYILADDKGIVGFVRLAFLLYGMKTSSLYYMYFTIFIASSLLFIAAYFHDPRKLALLVFLILALYVTMPGFSMFPAVVNILDTRTFGILSLVAVLHILLTAADRDPPRPLQVIAMVGQLFVITFVYHARASTMTQCILIALAYPVIVFVTRRAHPDTAGRAVVTVRRFVPLVLLLVMTMAVVPIYQRLRYNPGYFGQRALLHHHVYHNLLIGLQANPVLRERYGFGAGGDLGAANGVDDFLFREGRHRTPGLRHWAANGQNTVTTQRPFDWGAYNAAARDLYFKIWRQQPKEAALTYFYYHPLDVFRLYLRYTTIPRIEAMSGPAAQASIAVDPPAAFHFYNPFRPESVLVVLLTAWLSWSRRDDSRAVHILIALVVVAAAVTVPLVIYAGGFIFLAETFVATGFLLYTTLAFLLASLVPVLLRSRLTV